MKRIISIILVLFVLLSIVACDASEKKGYTVHFETNGGDSMEDLTTLRLEEEPRPSYKGHVFEGWFLDAELSTPAQFPMDIDRDITLYAKWLKVAHTEGLDDAKIKLAFGNQATAAYNVTPNGLDFELLESMGYDTITIEVKYTSKYEKDYSLPFGYAGAPKYGAVLLKSDFDTEFDDDFGISHDTFVEATITPSAKKMSLEFKISELGEKKVLLVFTTANIQNIVYLSDITVTYIADKSIAN